MLSFLGSYTNLVMTPFVFAGLGTPLSGAGTANGTVTTIDSIGDDFEIYTLDGWNLGIGGSYGTRSGAGKYSGNAANIFFRASKGF
jgi:hypothetical protein